MKSKLSKDKLKNDFAWSPFQVMTRQEICSVWLAFLNDVISVVY